MKVRCSNWEHCPLEDCPHWKEHGEFFGLDYVGGKGDVKVSRCHPVHTCGLVTPWVEVECLPVETEEEFAGMVAMDATTKVEPVPA
jgi:hypothetical protein